MYPKRLDAAEKILKSPIFILIVILWILFSVSLVAVPQPNLSFARIAAKYVILSQTIP